VFYPSKDGTRIPMFLVHTNGLQRDGTHPVFLYGYGGFEASIQPYYNCSLSAAGTLGKKQNCFDDFKSAAEYLIQEQYTTASRIAINGASNGGLLVGESLAQLVLWEIWRQSAEHHPHQDVQYVVLQKLL
ncbi:hypothetical protein GOODEAATRI_007607, partial [Goodea atripinnis]